MRPSSLRFYSSAGTPLFVVVRGASQRGARILRGVPSSRFSTAAAVSAKRHLASGFSSGARPPPPSRPASSAEQWAAALPDIPYGFPSNRRPNDNDTNNTAAPVAYPFIAEQSGGIQKSWLQRLPHQVATSQIQTERYLPNKDDFWRSPPYEALREIVLRTAYHDALKIITEHDYNFLFADVMCNDEAPMPHVIYEDFMQVLTFSSRQRPPEEQFALPEDVLRDLLCWAAYYCTLDPFYYTSASTFFRKVEQEQHLSPALHSAWVYICTAAGKVDEALAYAIYMDQHNIEFDPVVFSYMLHPSLTPTQQRLRHAPQTAKGVVLQTRLCRDMNQHHGATPVAVHAMFVYHILTLQHTRKWEVLRSAAELSQKLHTPSSTSRTQQREYRVSRRLTAEPNLVGPAVPRETISSRTMHLALSLFSSEKGVRWGPRTTKAMTFFMLADASAGATAADVLYVLMRIRRNERTAILVELPRTVFSEHEQQILMQTVYRRSRTDPVYAVAAPLLKELLTAGSPVGSTPDKAVISQHGDDEGIVRALQELQQLSATASEKCKIQSITNGSASAVSSTTPNSGSLSDVVGHSSAIALAEDNASQYVLSSSLLSDAADVRLFDRAEVARELLEAVMSLDRDSMRRETEQKGRTKTAVAPATADEPKSDVFAATLEEEKRLAALQSSMEVMGASASLASWSVQQAEQESAESRLRAQVHTAWIAPMYQP